MQNKNDSLNNEIKELEDKMKQNKELIQDIQIQKS